MRWFWAWHDSAFRLMVAEVSEAYRQLEVAERQYDVQRDRARVADREVKEAALRAEDERLTREGLEVSLRVAREDLRALQRRYAAHMNRCPVLDTVNDHDVDKARENAT